MKTYNALTGEEIENPDLEAGYTYPGKRYIGTEQVVMEGSVERYPPDGLRHEESVYEDCLFWRPREDPEDPSTDPDAPDDVPDEDVATWDELAAAYNEGVMSVG